MKLKMKQTKIGSITRLLNIITVGVLLTLIGFISSDRGANAAYTDPNCRDHNVAPVAGTSCPYNMDGAPSEYNAPTGRTQCAGGINGSTNVCCVYDEYETTCIATSVTVSYNYELSGSYGNSHCVNGHCLSWTAPGEGGGPG